MEEQEKVNNKAKDEKENEAKEKEEEENEAGGGGAHCGLRRQTGLGLNTPITFFLAPSANTEIFSAIQKNIFKQQRNILEIEIVIERRKDAMMQMLLRFDPSRNASGRHLPLCSTSTKILGSVLEQHTTHQCNGFIGTPLLYAMHIAQCSRFFLSSTKPQEHCI